MFLVASLTLEMILVSRNFLVSVCGPLPIQVVILIAHIVSLLHAFLPLFHHFPTFVPPFSLQFPTFCTPLSLYFPTFFPPLLSHRFPSSMCFKDYSMASRKCEFSFMNLTCWDNSFNPWAGGWGRWLPCTECCIIDVFTTNQLARTWLVLGLMAMPGRGHASIGILICFQVAWSAICSWVWFCIGADFKKKKGLGATDRPRLSWVPGKCSGTQDGRHCYDGSQRVPVGHKYGDSAICPAHLQKWRTCILT